MPGWIICEAKDMMVMISMMMLAGSNAWSR